LLRWFIFTKSCVGIEHLIGDSCHYAVVVVLSSSWCGKVSAHCSSASTTNSLHLDLSPSTDSSSTLTLRQPVEHDGGSGKTHTDYHLLEADIDGETVRGETRYIFRFLSRRNARATFLVWIIYQNAHKNNPYSNKI
jgi:hypothetical protein